MIWYFIDFFREVEGCKFFWVRGLGIDSLRFFFRVRFDIL